MINKIKVAAATVVALLIGSFSAPALDNCLTNFTLNITKNDGSVTCSWWTNASYTFTGSSYVGTSLTCDPNAMTFVINVPCSAYATDIGNYSWQCDTSRTCPGNEGAPTPCTGGSSMPLIVPANTSTWIINFRTYLCCSVTLCEIGRYGCTPPPQCEYKTIEWNNVLFADL